MEQLERRELLDNGLAAGLTSSNADPLLSSLYNNLLNRAPQPFELAAWQSSVNAGQSLQAVAQAFLSSPEYQADFITDNYATLLKRQPQAQEVNGWLQATQAGLSEESLTAQFLASDEYFQNHGGTPEDWLTGLYWDLFQRTPDATGFFHWRDGLQSGMTRERVAFDFVTSSEANARFVTASYEQFLGRAPDAAGEAAWVAALDSGLLRTQLVAGIIGSPEYVLTHSSSSPDLPSNPAANGSPANFAFGPAWSSVPQGSTRVSLVTYNPQTGYGWDSVLGLVVQDGGGIAGFDSTFRVDLPNGTYTVTPTLGNTIVAHSNMTVWAQGVQEVSGVNTAPGQFISPSFNVQVADGQLALRFTAGGAGNTFAVDQLDIAPTPQVTSVTGNSLALSPTTLPAGSADVAYSATVSALGGSGTYTFAITSGSLPSGLSLNANTGVLSGTPTAGGNSSFTITAFDSNTAGLTGSRTYTLAINGAMANPPVVSAGATISTKEGAAITFAGTVMGGTAPYTYAWDFGDGDKTSGSLTPTYTYANSGTYTARLTVTDAQKQIGQGTLQVTVEDVAPSVIIRGAPSSSPEGAPISLTSTVTSPSAAETAAGFTYSWNVMKNGAAYASATTPSFSFTPTEHGAYVITLVATAQDQASGMASQTVNIADVAPSVIINGAPASSTAGTVISLTSSVFSPSAADMAAGFRYAWSVSSNSTVVASGTTANFSFTPASAGTYLVVLTATDSDGATGTASQTILVAAASGWVHVQDDPGGGALSSPTATTNTFSLTPFSNPVTIGNYVLVTVTGLDNQKSVNAVDVTCTDNATTPNSYTQLYFHRETTGDTDGWVCLFGTKVAHNPSSGNISPTIHIGNGKTTLVSWGASEFSGGSLILDGSVQVQEYPYIPPPYNTTLNFTVTTTQPNDLLIGIFTDNRSGSYSWTLPSGFTALGMQSDGNDFLPGQCAYRIVSGTLSNQQLSWSNNGANQDGTVCAMIAALEV